MCKETSKSSTLDGALSWFINILHMPEGRAWNIAGGVARWKIYLCGGASQPVIFSSTYQKWQFVTRKEMYSVQLSPRSGISGSLASNIFDPPLSVYIWMSWRYLPPRWEWSDGERRGPSRDELITLSLARRIGYMECFAIAGSAFACLNVPVLMVWYGGSQANSNSPERNKLWDFLSVKG